MSALVALVITFPSPFVMSGSAQVIELNHFYRRDSNDPSFSQLILWRWHSWPPPGDFYVSDWMMVNPDSVLITDRFDKIRVTWRGKGGICYDFHCHTFRETRTFNDPEVDDRQRRPESKRMSQLGGG